MIASVDTYLRFAEAVNRLDLAETQVSGLAELRGSRSEEIGRGVATGAKKEAKKAATAPKRKLSEKLGDG